MIKGRVLSLFLLSCIQLRLFQQPRFYWEGYSKEAHANLAQMYVDDERFTAYYDKVQIGATEFLRDAVLIYTGINK